MPRCVMRDGFDTSTGLIRDTKSGTAVVGSIGILTSEAIWRMTLLVTA